MDSFIYYFDVAFLPAEFDSLFSNQIIDENKKQETNTIKQIETNVEKIMKKKKYVPQTMEASTLEFKRTKYNNRNVPNKRKR